MTTTTISSFCCQIFRWSLRVWNILLEPIQCTVRHWLLLDNSFLYCCGSLAVTLHSFSKRFKLDWLVRAELPLSPLKNQPVVSTLNSGAAATVSLNVRRENETWFGSTQTSSRFALSVLPRLGFVWQWVWRKVKVPHAWVEKKYIHVRDFTVCKISNRGSSLQKKKKKRIFPEIKSLMYTKSKNQTIRG